ncbi:MAG TPA: ABC transporter permease subunit, partial [Gemmataceae bacterium]|nr:ABC transporter permease subunit [Gemmataceae bacterium]
MAAGKPFRERVWGGASAVVSRTRRLSWVDLVVLLALCGLLYGLWDLRRQWGGQHRVTVTIDLSPWALPRYTFYSLSRGVLAYVLSLSFTLVYGYWAAKDRIAERVLIPLLDILQSTPVLTFLPPLLLAAESLFPGSNIGFELASIIMVFTGQAWNMTFSFYHSLRSLPQDMIEVATLYRFTTWQRFKWLEVPYSMMGLVWNSMMSFAGGWFFLTISEAFKTGDQDFRIPGIGSYMSEAVKNKEYGSMLWALLAMALMIITLDQLLWRPVVVWAQRFRVEEGGQGEAMTSWFLDWLRRSRLFAAVGQGYQWLLSRQENRKPVAALESTASRTPSPWPSRLSFAAFAVLLAVLSYGAWRLFGLLQQVSGEEWRHICLGAGVTLTRVLASLVIGTLWALPAGLAIGLSPRLSRVLQPVVQIVASFPAPLFFPLLVVAMSVAGVGLGAGSILLMLLGTQWYILFNVIAGTMAIPADLRECSRSYRMTAWQRFRVLYFPAVFPYLITGWVTAAGG